MSFSERGSPFIMPLQSYVPGSDAISILPQFSIENEDQNPDFDTNPPPFKRARNSEENLSNSSSYSSSRTTPPPPPSGGSSSSINRGVNNIFFKTRMCAKFKMGMCRNGEHCNFAHGIDDMRQPPPNWQEMVGLRGSGGGGGGDHEDHPRPQLSGNWEDDQIILRMKLCKKFYNGEECPYGDRCNFLHEEPARFREDSGKFRESSAISIGTTAANNAVASAQVGTAGGGSSSGNGGDESRAVPSNVGSDLLRGNVKPVYWKTKLCNKWEQTGHCPFGEKCHFAHGFPELQASSGRAELDSVSIASLASKPQASSANDLVSPGATNAGPFNEDLQGKKCLLKWKGLKKINRIYGDWLDDLPLAQNIPSRVES